MLYIKLNASERKAWIELTAAGQMSKMRKFHGLPKTIGLSLEFASPYVIIPTFAVTIWTLAYTDQPVGFLESAITEANLIIFSETRLLVFLSPVVDGFQLKIVYLRFCYSRKKNHVKPTLLINKGNFIFICKLIKLFRVLKKSLSG